MCCGFDRKPPAFMPTTTHTSARIAPNFGSPADIGRVFLTDHLVAFEITSIVLLVAAVGGVVLGSHARVESDARA